MKKALLPIGIILFVVGAYIFGRMQLDSKRIFPITPPLAHAKCGIQECHGLDLTCGPDVPEACTEIYQAGDNCRAFFECGITDTPNGGTQCAPVPNEKFNKCKTCVEDCYSGSGVADSVMVMECASRCTTNPNE